MSKFTITKTTEGRTWLVWRMSNAMGTTDTLTIELVDDDLSDLASCVQAALSGAKAETKCKCGATGPVCSHTQDQVSMWNDGCTTLMQDGSECNHDRACHS